MTANWKTKRVREDLRGSLPSHMPVVVIIVSLQHTILRTCVELARTAMAGIGMVPFPTKLAELS